MPFDGVDTKPAQPDAAYLSRVLRDRSMWPDGFEWCFSDSSSCALGIARSIWPNRIGGGSISVGTAFGLSATAVHSVFYVRGDKPVDLARDITPLHVADALDRAIAARAEA